jgi:hypothetical protein
MCGIHRSTDLKVKDLPMAPRRAFVFQRPWALVRMRHEFPACIRRRCACDNPEKGGRCRRPGPVRPFCSAAGEFSLFLAAFSGGPNSRFHGINLSFRGAKNICRAARESSQERATGSFCFLLKIHTDSQDFSYR